MSSKHEKTIQLMHTLFTDKLLPIKIKLIDNSHLHIGHEGAKSGGGHFAITVVSDKFSNMSRVKRHQLVYSCVNDLIKKQLIHALEIEAYSPEESLCCDYS